MRADRLLAPVLVLVVWLALWGEVSWANLASGVVVVALIGVMIRPVPRRHTVHPVGLAKLLVIFMWRLITSTAVVVRTVLAPTPDRTVCGVVAVRLQHDSPLVATVVADAISLTPGTLTLDAVGSPATLYVHVLGIGDPREVRDDIAHLERLVVAAIEPRPDDVPTDPRPAADGGAGA